MATESRTIGPDLAVSVVAGKLRREPFRFDFFQAVRLLERFLEERASVGPVSYTHLDVYKRQLLDQQQSREVGYEDQAKTDETKKKRAQLLKDGKLAPENFDKAFEETTKKFYAQSEQDLDACLETLARLKKICDEKFGDDGPAFGPLQLSLIHIFQARRPSLRLGRSVRLRAPNLPNRFMLDSCLLYTSRCV